MSIKVTVPALAHSLRFERILVISALHPTPDVSQRYSKCSEGPATNLLTKDEARQLSVNFAKLPELLRRRRSSRVRTPRGATEETVAPADSELGVRTGNTRVWGETTGVVLGRQPHGVHVYAKQTLQDQLSSMANPQSYSIGPIWDNNMGSFH